MNNEINYVPYSETGYFSKLVTDYLGNDPKIKSFYNYQPNEIGLAKAIEERANFPVNRPKLVNTLNKQYLNIAKSNQTNSNIQLLLNENTFTICTAHQPNLLTGYLYFVYKIIHAIKLAQELKKMHPDKDFVPVYYMGSEDNDIEELGTFRFRETKYIWDGDGQKGAVGRMNTTGLKSIFHEVFKYFGPPGENCDKLQQTISNAYFEHNTIGKATQYLVNELFGKYGLVIIDPDDKDFKVEFAPIMQDELINSSSYPIIIKQMNQLETNYKIQAQPRLLNLFYLNEQIRERIEQKGNKWIVLNSDIQWTKDELLKELSEYPEHFSPNVMLRGLYQETILPNIAFIGGGAEVAYWMQLKTLFQHHNVFYPSILLRQSVLWISDKPSKLYRKLAFSIHELFKNELELSKKYIILNSNNNWQIDKQIKEIENIFTIIEAKAVSVDITLETATKATIMKLKNRLFEIEKKMLRAEKRKSAIQMQHIKKLKNKLFPSDNLQERVENFADYYLIYGSSFFDILLDAMEPLKNQFLVIE